MSKEGHEPSRDEDAPPGVNPETAFDNTYDEFKKTFATLGNLAGKEVVGEENQRLVSDAEKVERAISDARNAFEVAKTGMEDEERQNYDRELSRYERGIRRNHAKSMLNCLQDMVERRADKAEIDEQIPKTEQAIERTKRVEVSAERLEELGRLERKLRDLKGGEEEREEESRG